MTTLSIGYSNGMAAFMCCYRDGQRPPKSLFVCRQRVGANQQQPAALFREMKSRLFDPAVDRPRAHPCQCRRFVWGNHLNLSQTSFAPPTSQSLARANDHDPACLDADFGSSNHSPTFGKPLLLPCDRITMRPVSVTLGFPDPVLSIATVKSSPTINSPRLEVLRISQRVLKESSKTR